MSEMGAAGSMCAVGADAPSPMPVSRPMVDTIVEVKDDEHEASPQKSDAVMSETGAPLGMEKDSEDKEVTHARAMHFTCEFSAVHCWQEVLNLNELLLPDGVMPVTASRFGVYVNNGLLRGWVASPTLQFKIPKGSHKTPSSCSSHRR